MTLSDARQRSLNNARFVPIGNPPADPAPAGGFFQSDLEKHPACCLCTADPYGSEGASCPRLLCEGGTFSLRGNCSSRERLRFCASLRATSAQIPLRSTVEFLPPLAEHAHRVAPVPFGIDSRGLRAFRGGITEASGNVAYRCGCRFLTPLRIDHTDGSIPACAIQRRRLPPIGGEIGEGW